jgi:hypothetical protein
MVVTIQLPVLITLIGLIALFCGWILGRESNKIELALKVEAEQKLAMTQRAIGSVKNDYDAFKASASADIAKIKDFKNRVAADVINIGKATGIAAKTVVADIEEEVKKL